MGDEFCEVELYREGKKLKKGLGYIKGSIVYIYRGKMEKFKKSELVAGIYLDRNDNYVFVEPTRDEAIKYSIDNISELDIDKIFNEVGENEDDFVQPEDIEIINNNSEVYIPTIKDDDDFLKYIVKKVIIDKKINLKNYKDKFTSQYDLNNMKSGLNKDTKMTVPNFKKWCEALGITWEMRIFDAGVDKLNPLPDDIFIESDNF